MGPLLKFPRFEKDLFEKQVSLRVILEEAEEVKEEEPQNDVNAMNEIDENFEELINSNLQKDLEIKSSDDNNSSE